MTNNQATDLKTKYTNKEELDKAVKLLADLLAKMREKKVKK